MAFRVTNVDDNETIHVGGVQLAPGQSTTVDVITDGLHLLRDRGQVTFDVDRATVKTGAIIRYTKGVPTGLEDDKGNYLGDLVLVKRSPSDGGMGIRANDVSPAIPLPVEKSKRLLVQMAGGAIYVRYAFDATWDAVQKILIDKARAAYKNNPVEFGGCNKIPLATADADTAAVDVSEQEPFEALARLGLQPVRSIA